MVYLHRAWLWIFCSAPIRLVPGRMTWEYCRHWFRGRDKPKTQYIETAQPFQAVPADLTVQVEKGRLCEMLRTQRCQDRDLVADVHLRA